MSARLLRRRRRSSAPARRSQSSRTQIAAAEADLARLSDLGGDAFKATINRGDRRLEVRDRKAAGEWIKAELEARGRTLWTPAVVVERAGELSGFVMQVGLRRKQGGLQFTVLLTGGLSYGRDEWFALNEDTDAIGLIRRFEGLIKGIPRVMAQKAEELEKARADLPRLERLIAAPAFGKQDQLDEARTRMLRLEAELQPSRQNGGQSMRADPRNDEWSRLDEETKTAARDVIARAHAEREHVSAPFGSGDLYAYPQGAEGICWGVNGGEDGFNIARGLMSGRELEVELQSAKDRGR